MVKRKSPVRHRVRSHTRKGKSIKSFVRGSGTKVRRPRRVVKKGPAFSDWQRVKEKFGTTRDPNMAIYILPDGSMLDGSGGKLYRSLDHMVISQALGRLESLSRTYDFCEESGTIRVLLSSSAEDATLNVMMHTNIAPTDAQWRTIGRMKPKRGQIVYDVMSKYLEYENKPTHLGSYGRIAGGTTGNVGVIIEDYSAAKSNAYIPSQRVSK